MKYSYDNFLREELENHLMISFKLNNYRQRLFEERGVVPHMEEYANRLGEYCDGIIYKKPKENHYNFHIDENLFSDIEYRFFDKLDIMVEIDIIDNDSDEKSIKTGYTDFSDICYNYNSERVPYLHMNFKMKTMRWKVNGFAQSLSYHEFTHAYADFMMLKKSGRRISDKFIKTKYSENLSKKFSDDSRKNIRYILYSMYDSEIDAFISQSYIDIKNLGIEYDRDILDIIKKIMETDIWKNMERIWENIESMKYYTGEMKEKALEYWNSISYLKYKTFDSLYNKILKRFINYKKKIIDGIVRNVETIMNKRQCYYADGPILDYREFKKSLSEK